MKKKQSQIRTVKNILEGAKEWDDDYAVDCEAYYFNGEIIFPDSEFIYYFTDEYNLIYYDHWFAEIHMRIWNIYWSIKKSSNTGWRYVDGKAR